MSNNETIFVNQFNTACLSQFSYYIESNKEAAIIDPVTDSAPYIQLLQNNESKLKYIFNTHLHSDYISGNFDLAVKTGATLVYGPNTVFYVNDKKVSQYEIENSQEQGNEGILSYLKDYNIKVKFIKNNEKITLGKIEVLALHTPGHTLESCCYVVIDGNGKSNSAFTGDTLLIGDVGRPDLAMLSVKRDNVFQKDLAVMLYKSLSELRNNFPENLTLYPCHSQGSPVGKNILAGQSTTIKQELQHNPLFKEMKEEEFLKLLAHDFNETPYYFNHISNMNIHYQTGRSFEYLLSKQNKAISLENMINLKINKQIIILDTRHPPIELEEGFIPNSINISLKAPFSIWSGYLLNPDDPLLIIASENKEKEAIGRLLRIGFRNIQGYLEGGFNGYLQNYEKVLDSLKNIEINKKDFTPIKQKYIKEKDAIQYVYNADVILLDVREKSEILIGKFPNSIHIPLTLLKDKTHKLCKDKDIYILCRTGTRSAMAFSILSNENFERIFILEGGLAKIKEKGIKV